MSIIANIQENALLQRQILNKEEKLLIEKQEAFPMLASGY